MFLDKLLVGMRMLTLTAFMFAVLLIADGIFRLSITDWAGAAYAEELVGEHTVAP